MSLSACAHDYLMDGLVLSERSKIALSEAKAAGIERGRAVSYIALSWRETAVEWTTVRRAPPLLFPLIKCPCRTAVGLERAGNGCFRLEVVQNPEAMAFLQENGWVKFAVPPESTTGDTCSMPNGQMNVPNSDAVAAFFEWAIDKRSVPLLGSFSLGPTQMWLRQSQVGGQFQCGFPTDWNDIWSLYTSSSVVEVFSHLHYLEKPCYNGKMPTDPGDPHANSVQWLTRHTGGDSVKAETIWAKEYQNALFMTQKAADSIGY